VSTRPTLADRAREQRRRDLAGWSSEQIVRTLLAGVVGLLMILASAFEASRATDLSEALAWLNLGVVGLVVAAVGNATWLLAGRESVSFARAALLPNAESVIALVAPIVVRRETSVPSGTDLFVGGDGLARYHRPECPFVAGRANGAASRRVHEAAGHRPCEICLP
jgi:hypothetical protein